MKKRVLLIGAGLFNLVLARLFKNAGYYVVIIEKNVYIGGLCSDYYDNKAKTYVSRFGAHILHFSKKTNDALKFIQKYTNLIKYNHKVLCIGNASFSYFPINNTYKILYQGIFKPFDLIENEFIGNYSRKMWGKHWPELSKHINNTRAKIKDSIDNSFFEDERVFIPSNGYTNLFKKLAKGIKIVLNKNQTFNSIGGTIHFYDYIFISSPIDKFFNFMYEPLDWRGLKFAFHRLESKNNILPTSVVNFPTHPEILRIVEHNQFYNSNSKNKIISVEYPCDDEQYYPVFTDKNLKLYKQYKDYCTSNYPNVIFTGRLGGYKYYDMDDSIMEALKLFDKLKIKKEI